MKAPPSFIINPHTANFLRFSALGVGVVYGAYRYKSLCEYVKKRTERREIEHKIELAKEGKILYQAHLDEKMKEAARKSGVVIDMEALDYDAEKHISWLLNKMENEKSGTVSSSPPSKK